MKQLHLIIQGKVQGVFFRDSTREMAKQLNLTGWVRNNSDGTVEAVFQGEEDNLKRMLEYSNQGPNSAQVKKIKIEWEEISEKCKDFKII
jgi:acylphosphatase